MTDRPRAAAPAGPGSPPATPGAVRPTEQVEVSDDRGAVVGRARITPPRDPAEPAVISLEPDIKRAQTQQREDLVDAALDHDVVDRQVHVVAPLGDADTIGRLQERTENFNPHRAGSSSVIDADIIQPDAVEQD